MRTGPEFDDFVRSRSAALVRTAYALVGDQEMSVAGQRIPVARASRA